MREIKFRAWDRVVKNWVPEGLLEVSSHVFIKKSDIRGGFVIDTFDSEAGRFILMQFTGLKDKNGVEIYEGDILNMGDLFNTKVLWCDDTCRWWLSGKSDGKEIRAPLAKYNQKNFEVISNIYEKEV